MKLESRKDSPRNRARRLRENTRLALSRPSSTAATRQPRYRACPSPLLSLPTTWQPCSSRRHCADPPEGGPPLAACLYRARCRWSWPPPGGLELRVGAFQKNRKLAGGREHGSIGCGEIVSQPPHREDCAIAPMQQ